MGITLSTPEKVATDNAPLPPLLPVPDGGPITAAGVTLAVCARASAPTDLRLCRKGDRKLKDADGEPLKDADGNVRTEVAWRGTDRVEDHARAFTAGLYVLPSK